MANQPVIDETPSGYWLYEDGRSFWGVNVVRFGKFGIKISEALHKSEDVEARKAHYAEESAKLEAAAKAAKPKAWGDGNT
jgi:hypothetical protein